jgi:hypothetical protein
MKRDKKKKEKRINDYVTKIQKLVRCMMAKKKCAKLRTVVEEKRKQKVLDKKRLLEQVWNLCLILFK